MQIELKPCPFCGGAAHIEQPGTRRQSCVVECDSCGINHESGDEGEMCGTSWNRRIAAHSAGAQGEPYGWIGFDNTNGLNAAFSFGPAKPESCTYYFPLYAEPKPMPQTDAARDVLAKAVTRYDELTGSIQGCTDGGCLIRKPEGMHTNGGCRCARDHMKMQRAMYAANELRNALAEIERLERAKGE